MAKKAKKVEIEESQFEQKEVVLEEPQVVEQPKIRERKAPSNEWEIKDRLYN